MPRRLISSGSTFEQNIGYSRAVVDGDWVFVSGTTGFNYQTMTISDDIVEQATQCLKNIDAALNEAGFGWQDIVRVHYLLLNRAGRGRFLALRHRAGALPFSGSAGFRALLAAVARVFRRGSTRRDDDGCWFIGPAHEDRDRSHRA